MSLADDKFLLTGTYAIINAEYNHSTAFSEQDNGLSSSSDDCGVNYRLSDSMIVLIVFVP